MKNRHFALLRKPCTVFNNAKFINSHNSHPLTTECSRKYWSTILFIRFSISCTVFSQFAFKLPFLSIFPLCQIFKNRNSNHNIVLVSQKIRQIWFLQIMLPWVFIIPRNKVSRFLCMFKLGAMFPIYFSHLPVMVPKIVYSK